MDAARLLNISEEGFYNSLGRVSDSEVNAIDEKYESVYFFSAMSYKEIEAPSFFELTYSFRQSEDKDFYSLLNNIRLGNDLEESIDKINRACYNPEFTNESSMIITTRKYRAEQINEEMLNLIEGPATAAKSEEYGELNENDLPAPRVLRIKKDSKVMFIKNDSEGRWVNGTVGVVTNCNDKNRKVIKVKVGKGIFKVKKNPLPWVEEMINAPVHGNFFENRVTDYAKGALSGTWGDVWGKAA